MGSRMTNTFKQILLLIVSKQIVRNRIYNWGYLASEGFYFQDVISKLSGECTEFGEKIIWVRTEYVSWNEHKAMLVIPFNCRWALDLEAPAAGVDPGFWPAVGGRLKGRFTAAGDRLNTLLKERQDFNETK